MQTTSSLTLMLELRRLIEDDDVDLIEIERKKQGDAIA
jgi:hypothetical protein